MATELASYIHFDGNCRAALDFYAENLGATIEMVSTYGEAPAGENAPQGDPDWILYARLTIAGQPIMMSDAPVPFQEPRSGFNVTLDARYAAGG